MIWDRPIRFSGPPEQANANRASHRWFRPAPDETPECMDCCAKSWHAAAEYPCGESPPREQVVIGRPSEGPAPRRDLDG